LAILFCVAFFAGCASPPGSAKKRFTVGMYGVRTTEDLRDLSRAGFNFILANPTEELLLEAQKLQVDVCAYPGTSAGYEFSHAKAREAIRRYDRFPSLWGWYVIDEPDLNEVPPTLVKEANSVFKKYSNKPTVLVLYNGLGAQQYSGITDYLFLDRYPINWIPLSNLPQHLRLAKFAHGKDRPVFAVLQAFDWTYYPGLAETNSPKRPPTYTEMRCMTYCALVENCQGIVYYAYNDPQWKLRDQPQVWNSLTNVVAEVNRYQALFSGNHAWWTHDLVYEKPELMWNEALMGSITARLIEVEKGDVHVPPGFYIVAVNTTPKTIKTAFKPRSFHWQEAPDFLTGTKKPLQQGWLMDEYEPYGIRIFGPIQLK